MGVNDKSQSRCSADKAAVRQAFLKALPSDPTHKGAVKALDTALALLDEPQATQEHVKIEHPHRPAEADYEYSDLIRRIKSQGGDGVAVGILMQYAFASPPQGSYAGSLWALAEWVNERLVIPALSRPERK